METHNFKKQVFFMVFIIFAFNQAIAQNDTEEELSSNLVSDVGLENFQFFSTAPTDEITTTQNFVFIEQIGSNNLASATIKSENKEFSLLQNGDSNTAKINISAKTTVHNVMQNGDNNFFIEYGKTSNLNLERTILQDGNDQNLVIYGSNSMSDKIILNQQGNAKSITIRNFN